MEVEVFKSARRWRAKQVKKSKCEKHSGDVKMWTSPHRCGAKHVLSKSKCTKRTRLEALFEAEMLKKCAA